MFAAKRLFARRRRGNRAVSGIWGLAARTILYAPSRLRVIPHFPALLSAASRSAGANPINKLDSGDAAAKRRGMTDATATLTPKPWISGIAPYVPGKSAGADGRPLIKLSANENPLGTGEKAWAAVGAAPSDSDAR
jgi:hypothetical protein